MGTRAEILLSYIDDLDRVDAQIGRIIKANRAELTATQTRVADSIARMERSSRKAGTRQIRKGSRGPADRAFVKSKR